MKFSYGLGSIEKHIQMEISIMESGKMEKGNKIINFLRIY